MKKIACFILCLSLAAVLQLRAQTQPSTQTGEPRTLSDKTMSTRLQQDISSRNSSLGNTPVSWFDAGYGYYGTYSMNNQNYMARYDRNGNYVETLNRKEWNDQIPGTTRNAFDQSMYKDQQVTAYWEVTDPGRKGSYYELSDATGKKSRVWADDKGKFSTQPPASTAPRP
jgi:hypothetical protein